MSAFDNPEQLIEDLHVEAEDLADLAKLQSDEQAARELFQAAQSRVRKAARIRAQMEEGTE